MGHRRGTGRPGIGHPVRLDPRRTSATEGPYAESKEHLAGFFVIDCATRERADEIAAYFAQPGGTVELRPIMSMGSDDQ